MYKPKGCIKALKIIDKEMSKGDQSKFLVYYDPDIDGLVAGFLSQKFLERFGKPSMYYINENREHGFKMSDKNLEKLKGYTIIAVDFAMTRAEIKKVIAAGANIVSIDHHHIEDDFVYEVNEETGCEGVIINNQYKDEPAEYKFLSGAGVVYYVIQYILERFGGTLTKDDMALVGISLLSDIRPTECNIAKSFLDETFTNKSSLMTYLVDVTTKYDAYAKYESFGLPSMNRNYIDYQFSPRLNALFRLNEGDKAIKLMAGNLETRLELKENDALTSKKEIQKSIVDDILLNLKGFETSNLIIKGLPHGYQALHGHPSSNFIGLACSRMRGDYKTSFIYVEGNEEGVIQRGSVRGLYDTVDYLKIFKSCGVNCEGHKNAFGVMNTDLKKIDLNELNDRVAEAEKEGKELIKRNQRVLEVSNLSMFLSGKNKDYARYNTYVRDAYRVYLKYTGSNIQEHRKARMVEYIIDGISVKCFDMELSPMNGLLLPVCGRGDYIEFTLRKALV